MEESTDTYLAEAVRPADLPLFVKSGLKSCLFRVIGSK